MIDFYITAIKQFISEGMSPHEIVEEFDQQSWHEAVRNDVNIHGNNSQLLDFQIQAMKDRQNSRDLEQAAELWIAGWTSEIPEGSKADMIFQLQWRSPAKGSRKIGRRYLSTNQAYNALSKSRHNASC